MSAEAFEDRTRVAGFEGGALYVAERDGQYWILVDEGTMRGMLSEEDAEGIEFVKTRAFDTAEERAEHVRERYGVELTP